MPKTQGRVVTGKMNSDCGHRQARSRLHPVLALLSFSQHLLTARHVPGSGAVDSKVDGFSSWSSARHTAGQADPLRRRPQMLREHRGDSAQPEVSGKTSCLLWAKRWGAARSGPDRRCMSGLDRTPKQGLEGRENLMPLSNWKLYNEPED